MRLLERLDALDARFGLGPKANRRPPNRRTRWIARHPWLFTLVWVALMVALELPLGGVTANLGIVVAVHLCVGHLVARLTQNQVRSWDAAHPSP